MAHNYQDLYKRLPFEVKLSFEPLFRAVDAKLAQKSDWHEQLAELFSGVKERARSMGDMQDAEALLRDHEVELRVLLNLLFSELADDNRLASVGLPFNPDPLFATEKYLELHQGDSYELSVQSAVKNDDYLREKLLFAYLVIYRVIYAEQHTSKVLVTRAHDKATGLDRFFLAEYGFDFVDVDTGKLDVLPQQQFERLLLTDDLDALVEAMPLENVVFSGLSCTELREITELENISLLKSDLVENDALNDSSKFANIVQRLRSVLQVEDLEAGLMFRYQSMRDNRNCTQRSILKGYDGDLKALKETFWGQMAESKGALIEPDLPNCGCGTDIVSHLIERGFRSLALVPLMEGEDLLGALELASKEAGVITAAAIKKLADLLPVLTIAVRREMDEVESRIERTIKEKCTAIHPAVEWRFVDAAYEYNNAVAENGSAEFDDIVFRDVHPLYGSMDIRSSSVMRNEAIQADLLAHLELARKTLAAIHEQKSMPIADYYMSAVQKYEKSVAGGLMSGDEVSIIEFMHTRVEPFFTYVRDNEPLDLPEEASCPIRNYFDHIDPAAGILYDKRKDYEDSVRLINETLSDYLDMQEYESQAIFPHYFEKYRTDGVEFNIYIGQDMSRDHTFEEVQLKNIRLWQLQVMCGMARTAESLLPRMKVKLHTTPLVLVHASPLTIKFSADEKQFEVEGSYNVRYEIIKKRIDKATIHTTGERFTQPGMLAVVYSQDRERQEYERYFEYLADKGLLDPDFEHVILEDLQGVHGLRGIRAKIVMA